MPSLSLKWIWGRSIRWQLIGGVAILYALLMTVFIAGLIRWRQHSLLDGARSRAQSEAALLATASAPAVATHDSSALSEIVKRLAAADGVRSAAVTDMAGDVLFRWPSDSHASIQGTAPLSQALVDPQTPHFFRVDAATDVAAAPLVASGRTIGWAWVEHGLADVTVRLEELVLAGLCYTLVSAGVGTLFAAVLARTILKPLKLLQDGVGRFAADLWDKPIPITSENEVAGVSRAFNAAMDRLNQQQKHLQSEIAERFKAQQALADLYAAGKREEENLRRAKVEAEESNQTKDHFLAILSHELRTPLTPVLTLAQMLERDSSLTQSVREDITTIRRNVEQEARLIDDLMDLTRIERGKVEMRFASVNVHEKLREVVRQCRSGADAKRLEISMELWADHSTVRGDEGRLGQVFMNLLGNAIKFTPTGGRIAIQTHREPRAIPRPGEEREARILQAQSNIPEEENDLVIEFCDSGVGIEPAMLDRIFDAFEQGSRETTRVFGGLGLGLTISRALVQLHEGQLTARSEGRDRGSTFTVRLPTAAASLRRSMPVGTAAHGNPEGGARRRILLVEDQPDTARLTARLLSQFGYEVQTAESVATAIQLTRNKHFDLIVSDIGLPDGTGHQLIRRLIAEAPSHDLKGIAISGLAEEEDVRRSQEAGFIEHLIKPLDPQIFLHSVEEALQNPREQTPPDSVDITPHPE
jgi:signal transduction histidine kinase/ActR/RegA family two-component response regulator